MLLTSVGALAQPLATTSFSEFKTAAPDASATALEKIEKLAEENKVQMRAELALLETVIKTIETTQYVNESLGLDRTKLYVEVPFAMIAGTAIGGIGGSVLAGRLADITVQAFTPEKAKWFAEYTELKTAERTAKNAYRQAVRRGTPDVQELKIALLESEKALTAKLLGKPGALYRLLRVARFTARGTVVLAGMTMTAISANETLLLAIGRDEMNKVLEVFKEKADKLETLINQ